jgi:uncharacterized protein (DUF2236 family)
MPKSNAECRMLSMTEESARAVANIVLGAAAVGAAVYIARTPPLRRAAGRVVAMALTGTLPAWFRAEFQRAWAESGQRYPPGPAVT